MESTQEFINNQFMKEVGEVKQDIKDLRCDFQGFKMEIIQAIADLPETFDERYASKNIEKWFYAGLGIILTMFVGSLVYLVLSHGGVIVNALQVSK